MFYHFYPFLFPVSKHYESEASRPSQQEAKCSGMFCPVCGAPRPKKKPLYIYIYYIKVFFSVGGCIINGHNFNADSDNNMDSNDDEDPINVPNSKKEKASQIGTFKEKID
jgi:hypothetical protein